MDLTSGDAGDDANLKRQRVSRACDLCRRKKIKCDGLVPVCSNCQAFNLECTYRDTTKKRGPPKGYIEAIENRLHKLEQVLADIAGDNNDPRSQALLAELHTPLETPHGEQITTRPVRRGRGRNKNRTFMWQQQQQSATPPPHPRSPSLMGSPTNGNAPDTTTVGEPSSPGSVISDSNGQLSMDETGQVRYLGKSSGFYLLQNSRTYQNGAFHLAGWGHRYKHPSSSTTPLDPLELPPKDLSTHLIHLYFKHFYPILPIFYKRRLASSMDPPADAISPLLLNAIYAVASRVSPDLRVRSDPGSADTAGDIYFERAKCLLDNYYDVPRISTVQALLLMALHQHGSMRAPRAWLYSGLAFRMAQDLGLNRNCDHWDIKPDERERRKRVFWCCFIVDRLLSANFGRASVFEERDCDVPFPSVDDDEPLTDESASTVGRAPVRLLDAFIQLIKICDILGHVLKSIYYAKSRHHAPGTHHDHVLSALNQQLTNWYNNMPSSLQYDLVGAGHGVMSDPPTPISQMHLIYYTTVILLHRPFIPVEASSGSYNICASAANSILDIVDIMLNENHLKYVSNFTVYYIFTAGIIFLKSAASSEDGHKSLDAKVKINKIMRALDEIELTWTTAARSGNILGELAGLRDINLEYEDDHKKRDDTPPLSIAYSTSSPQQQQQQAPPEAATTSTAPGPGWNTSPADRLLPRYPWLGGYNSTSSSNSSPTTMVPTVDPFAAPGTMSQSAAQPQFDPMGAAFWGVPISLDMNEWNSYLGAQGTVSTQQPVSSQPLIPSHEFQSPRFMVQPTTTSTTSSNNIHQQPPPPPPPLQQQQQQDTFGPTNHGMPKQHLIHNDEGVNELANLSAPSGGGGGGGGGSNNTTTNGNNNNTSESNAILGFLGGQPDTTYSASTATSLAGTGPGTRTYW